MKPGKTGVEALLTSRVSAWIKQASKLEKLKRAIESLLQKLSAFELNSSLCVCGKEKTSARSATVFSSLFFI